jgi:predicted HTH transcriptional regulator
MEYGLYEHYVNLFKIIVSLITINKMSEFAFFRFMSLNMLNLEEQQHKDELVSLTEQVLDAKGIECDSKVSKISEEELREILEQVRKLIKKRKERCLKKIKMKDNYKKKYGYHFLEEVKSNQED